MDVLRAVVLIAATMTMGVMAGIFQLYAYAIMPGLKRVNDRTFVGAFQAIDRQIINPIFLSIFFGALILSGLAAVLHLGSDEQAVLPWAAIAFVLYLFVVVATIVINVPSNDAIKAAGDPDHIDDLAAQRQAFNEARWATSNVARALLSTVALACLAWALVEYGRL